MCPTTKSVIGQSSYLLTPCAGTILNQTIGFLMTESGQVLGCFALSPIREPCCARSDNILCPQRPSISPGFTLGSTQIPRFPFTPERGEVHCEVAQKGHH